MVFGVLILIHPPIQTNEKVILFLPGLRYSIRKTLFFPAVDNKCQIALSFDSFSSSSFGFFSIKVSNSRFLLEADYSFLKLLKSVLYIGIGILIGQKWQKCYQYTYISIFQSVSKTTAFLSFLKFGIDGIYFFDVDQSPFILEP